jgi:nucleotidyltransferase substrate binding protein (TIGR01987 family)
MVTCPLAAVLAQLMKYAALSGAAVGREHPDLVVAATIQAFEYTYELAIRLMKRRLESMAVSSAEIEQVNVNTLVRTAAEKGLIDDSVAWMLFREKRNITSHTYDEAKAKEVLAVIPQFIEKATLLLDKLESLNDVSR